jgi:hypothetical protein
MQPMGFPAQRSLLDSRGLISYLAIAFGLAWATEFFTLVGPGIRFDQHPPAWTGLVLMGVMWVPALAAFVVRRWITHEGFASAGLRRGPWHLYFAVWLAVPLLFATVYLLTWMAGLGRLDPELKEFTARVQTYVKAIDVPLRLPSAGVLLGLLMGASLTLAPAINCIFTFGEEFGWTGYLVPKLLPLGKWKAAVIYGIVWGGWHAPLIAIGYNYDGYPRAGLVFMCLFTVALGCTQMALRLRSGSVLLPTFLHACVNAQARSIWPLLFVGINPLWGGITGALGLAVLGPLGVYLLARSPSSEREA